MNTLALVVGPSGVGKNTLIEWVRNHHKFGTPVSCTTRERREGEIDGVHYRFITRKEFEDKVNREEFSEWAEVHGNLYGTLSSDLYSLLASESDVIFDLDIQGAKQLKSKFPEAILIFIAPPSVDKLEERIAKRNRGENPEEITRRLENARVEMRQIDAADYVIVNDDLATAQDDLLQLIEDLDSGNTPDGKRFRNQDAIAMCLSV